MAAWLLGLLTHIVPLYPYVQAVSCLAFSDSGGLLVSAGEDTLVAAWLLAEVLDEQRDGPAAAAAAVGMARVEPLHTW